WRQYPLQQKLAQRLPTNWIVRVHNDASAFAAAERGASGEGETDDLLLVLLSEGIGGAVVRDGRVAGGGHGYAGEIGHTIVTAGGRTDTFEMLAGVAHFESIFPPDQTVGHAAAATLARQQDPHVGKLLEGWAEALAIGLANAVHLLDPRQIILGGPLSPLFSAVERQVVARLDQYLIYGFARPPIRIATSGSQGSAIGAAAIVQETIFDLPLRDEGARF
ncbi:MAG TPA: ROK family protein, partial [Rhizobium sp.]